MIQHTVSGGVIDERVSALVAGGVVDVGRNDACAEITAGEMSVKAHAVAIRDAPEAGHLQP